MKNLNFAIIGCGDVTEVKSGPAFKKIEGSNLYSVMRRNEEKLIDYARRHQIDRYTTNYLEILEDPEVDAVYIATPPDSHHFYTLEAAKHGKAVYVEKPMGLNVKECQEMITACQENDVDLFVAYYRRGQEKFNKVKELLDTNVIGDIRSFNLNYSAASPEVNPNRAWLLDKDVAGGGMLFDIGSHMVDLLLYLFGEVKMATGISSNQEGKFAVHDNTSGFIQFKNSVQGTVQFTFNGASRKDELTVVGSKGRLVFSIMSNTPVKLFKDGKIEEFAFEEIEHVQMPFIKEVVSTLLGTGELESNGIYGLRTQEVLEVFEKSTSIIYE